MVMEQTLRDRLQRLLNATRSTCETTQDPEDEPNPNLSLVVVSRTPGSHPTTHWAIAVITDERTRRCRVFHLSDVHILGLRSLGWAVFAQDEVLDRSSSYQGGVRIGLVERDDLSRLEEVRHSTFKRAFLVPIKPFHRRPTRPSAAPISPLPHPPHGTARTGCSQPSSTSTTKTKTACSRTCSSRTAWTAAR